MPEKCPLETLAAGKDLQCMVGLSADDHASSQVCAAEPATEEPLPLDETCFPSFAQLTRDCQEYAKLSGCRFSIKAFEGIGCETGSSIPIVSEARSQDTGPLLAAKLQAAPNVRSFSERLRSGEADLFQDLSRAFAMIIKESARNSMIAACKAADFFPPSPAPLSVEDDDCAWDEEGLASPPVIAQRLYNDEVHRLHNIVNGQNLTLVRAKTASFIVEFADEVGVTIPGTSSHSAERAEQFQQDIDEWTKRKQISSMQSGAGQIAPQLASRETLAAAAAVGTVLGFGVLGVMGAALMTTRSSAVHRRCSART
jgi:hypothetical protein